MTMLPDIDETTWDEYDRQRLAQELEQKQQQFALQQAIGDKIAAVGTIGAPEAQPETPSLPSPGLSATGGWASEPAAAPTPQPPPTLPPDEPAPPPPSAPAPEEAAPPPEPAATQTPPDLVMGQNAPTPPTPPPSLDTAPPTPSSTSPVSDWAANAFATGLNAVHQAGGDADAFAQNFTSSRDPGQLIANAMNAASSAGADVDQFLSNFRLPAQPAETSAAPSLTFLGDVPTGGRQISGQQADFGPIDSSSHQSFVQTIQPYAQKWENVTGIPSDYLIAWAASESNWGKAGNALFGIKQGSQAGTAPGLRSATWEAGQGATTDTFANYNTPDEAFASLDQFLQGKRYQDVYQQLRAGQITPDQFMQGINQRGYATDPVWGQKVGQIARQSIDPLLSADATNQPKTSTQELLSRTGSWTPPAKQISQLGDPQLSLDEAYAACGPAAAVRFAQMYGRNPSLREATDLAKTVGWTSAQGMAGLGSEKALMDKLGIATKMVGADTTAMAREAQTGNPVTISTPGHYFFADNYDPKSGAFHVGQSGLDLRGGSEWMTPAQMESRMGRIQGALFADNPQVPADSTSQLTFGGMIPGGTSNPVGDFFSGLGSTAQDIVQAPPPVRRETTPAVPADMLEDQSAAAPPVVQPPEPSQSPVDRLKSAFSDFVDSIGGTKDQAVQALSQVPDVSAAGLVDIGARPETAQAAQDLVSNLTPPIDTSTPLGRLRSGDSITDLTPAEQAQAFSDWNKTFLPGPAADLIGGVAPALRGGQAALDVLEQQRQEQLNRDLSNNPTQLIPLPGGMSIPVFPDQVDAARRGDWGEFMTRTLEMASRAAGTMGGADADASPWVSAGLTAAGVDPDSARVLGQVANLVGPVAFERIAPRAVEAAQRGGAAAVEAAMSPEVRAALRTRQIGGGRPFEFGPPAEGEDVASTVRRMNQPQGDLPFGTAGAQPQTGAGLLDNALGRLERNYPAEVAAQIRDWATATEGPASQIASTVERWMVDNPIATVAERPTAREAAEIVQELETGLRGRGPAAGGTRAEREQIPLFGEEGGYEVRMPEGEGGPGLPSTSDPQAENWLQRLKVARTREDFQALAEDLQRSGLVGDRESGVTEGAQRVMPGFEEGRQPNLPEGVGGPGLPSTSDPAAEAWLQRLREARTAEDFAALDRDLQRTGLTGGRTTQQEGYLPGFEPLNAEVASGQHAELRAALEKLGLLGEHAAPTEEASAPGLNYERLARIRKEGITLEMPNMPDKKTNLADRIVAFLNSNMLLTPHSALMNIASQTEQTVRAPIIRLLAGYPDEAIAGVKMLAGASGDGLRGMFKVLGTGRQSRWSEEAGGGKIHWESPGIRTNAAIDEAYRTVGGAQEMGMEAARVIRENPGVPIEQVLEDNKQRLRAAAEKGAAHSVFQDGGNTTFGSTVSKWRSDLMNDPDWRKKALGILIYGAVPFSRVPEVVWNTGLRRLPAVNEAFGTAKFIQAYRKGDVRGMRLTAAETGLDTAINLAIAGEAAAGNITAKDDPEHPWSIRLPGNTWLDYRGTGPLALRLGTIASVMEANQEQANKLKPELVADSLDKTGALLSSQWYLDSAVGTLSLIREGRLTDAASKFLTQSADRLMPLGGALNYIEQSTDPVMRDPSKELPNALFERQQSRIPGLAELLPPRISTTTGEPVQRGAQGFGQAALGLQTELSDPAKSELARLHRPPLNYALNPPPEDTKSITFGGAEIPFNNDDERRTYLAGRGKFIGQVADRLLASENYQNASDDGKAAYWQSIIDDSANHGLVALRDRIGQDELLRRWRAGYRSTGRLEPVPEPAG